MRAKRTSKKAATCTIFQEERQRDDFSAMRSSFRLYSDSDSDSNDVNDWVTVYVSDSPDSDEVAPDNSALDDVKRPEPFSFFNSAENSVRASKRPQPFYVTATVIGEFAKVDDDSEKYVKMLREIVNHDSWENKNGYFRSVPNFIKEMRALVAPDLILISDIQLLYEFSFHARIAMSEPSFKDLGSQHRLEQIAQWDSFFGLSVLRLSISKLHNEIVGAEEEASLRVSC